MHTKHVVCSLLLFAGTAMAQDAAKQRDPFALSAGSLELSELVDACAGYLEWNILYDQGGFEKHSATKLQRPLVTDRDGCEELLYSLLHRQGFAVVPVNLERRIYEVVDLDSRRSREVHNAAIYKAADDILARPTLKVPVITTVKLEHINAQLANNALRPFFAGSRGANSIQIGTVGNQQSLIVQGFQDQVAQALRVIQLADTPQDPALERIDGKPLREVIKALMARIEALEAALKSRDK